VLAGSQLPLAVVVKSFTVSNEAVRVSSQGHPSLQNTNLSDLQKTLDAQPEGYRGCRESEEGRLSRAGG